MLFGEGVEDLNGVVADVEESDPVGWGGRPPSLQLDQLRSAERSPAGAAVEDHEGLAGPPRRVEVDHGARLVGQPDFREALTLVGPDQGEVSRRQWHRLLPLFSLLTRRSRRWIL